ncbi:TPA: hypothetical protein ACGO3D_000042 [Streptococcus suis]
MKRKNLYRLVLLLVAFTAMFLCSFLARAETYSRTKNLTYLDEATVPQSIIYVGDSGRIRPLSDSLIKDFQYGFDFFVDGKIITDDFKGNDLLELDRRGNWQALKPGLVYLAVSPGESEEFRAELAKYAVPTEEGPQIEPIIKNMYTVKILPINTSVYRLYHPILMVHLYTIDMNEKEVLSHNGWRYEGEAWSTSTGAGNPVYRLYHPELRFHFYTKDSHEYEVLGTRGWVQEGEAYRTSGTVPVYRLYHEGIKKHLFTTDTNEKNTLMGYGWRYEGVAWTVE